MITEFEVNSTYHHNFIGDSRARVEWKIIKRTAKTVTIQDPVTKGTTRKKIHVYDNEVEFIYPFGVYSMCPVLKASNRV